MKTSRSARIRIVILKQIFMSARLYLLLHTVICGLHVSTAQHPMT